MNTFRNYLLVTIIFITLGFTLGLGQVSNVIAQACTPAPFGMVGWWPGDGNANDIQGNNHGTLQNGAAFAPGMVGQSISFDGVDDYVDVGDVDLPSTFSIDAWVRPNDVATTQYVVSKDDGSTARSYFFAIEASGTLVGSVRNTTGGFTQYRTSVPVVVGGTWQHVTMTYDGGAPNAGKMAFYVNGVSYPISVIGPYDSGGTPEDNALALKIGIFGYALGNPFNGPFNGMIDELEVFSRVLAVAEIQAIYNADSAGKCKVTYSICPLYDQTRAVKRGATIPIKLQLCDGSGGNVSSSSVVVTATAVTRISDNAPGVLDDAGNANPDNNFRYEAALGGTGGYIFNLKTTDLSSGTYRLSFTAGNDPTTHSVEFQVK